MSIYWPYYSPPPAAPWWTTMTSTSSTFHLVTSFSTWREALAFAECGRARFTGKPRIRRATDGWVVRYTPRWITNGGN